MLFTLPIHEHGTPGDPNYPHARSHQVTVHKVGARVKLPGRYDTQEVPTGSVVITTAHGYIHLTRPKAHPEYLWVSHILVQDAAQGRGEGTQLYLAALAAAKKLGLKGVMRGGPGGKPSSSAQRRWQQFEREGRTRTLSDGSVVLVESNDCHTPSGSPAGGQFCSKTGHPIVGAEKLWASMGDSKTFVHGSRRDLGDELHGGSMFSDSPSWAAGYATRQDLEGLDWFEGHVYAMGLPVGPAVYVRTVHAAERKLLDMAKQLNDGKEAPSLKAAADTVAAKTDLVAILAREPGGKLTGGILVRPTRILSTTDPADAVRVATRRGHLVASNVLDALKRAH